MEISLLSVITVSIAAVREGFDHIHPVWQFYCELSCLKNATVSHMHYAAKCVVTAIHCTLVAVTI